jgi:DNA processing protein
MEVVYRIEESALDDRRVCRTALNLVLADRRKLATRILDRFPNPADALRTQPENLADLGLTSDEAHRLFPEDLLGRGQKELHDAEKMGLTVLTPDDEAYPQSLRETFDPPLVLYCLGRPEVLKEPSLAVVGARRPTPYGRAMAESLSREAARNGLVIVSGLAFGIEPKALGVEKNIIPATELLAAYV